MLLKLPIIALFLLLISCRAENESLSVTELLTRQPWILASYGFDENENGMIDTNEESIAACEEDNLYLFYRNGTGIFMDNRLSCATGISELPFTWKLINNHSALDFQFAVSQIQSLTIDQLIIYHHENMNTNRSIRYIQIFKH